VNHAGRGEQSPHPFTERTRILNATDTVLSQLATIRAAIAKLQAAVDDVTDSVDPENTTWQDVSRLAQIVDAVVRAELV
jgi:hypothetical protein